MAKWTRGPIRRVVLPPAAVGRALLRGGAVAFLAALTVAAMAEAAARGADAVRPLETAIVDPVLHRARRSGGSRPRRRRRRRRDQDPALLERGRAARNGRAASLRPIPRSRAYNWSSLDAAAPCRPRARARAARLHRRGARPGRSSSIDGAVRPDPADYRAFALAAVRRYSGQLEGLPRVRYWQAWNEPNKVPSRSDEAGTAAWYRTLVNAFAASAHSVPGNEVVAGGLAPFGISTSVAPLDFMRSVLCVDTHPACHDPVHFDIWSTDPYTAGGPTHVATTPAMSPSPSCRR